MPFNLRWSPFLTKTDLMKLLDIGATKATNCLIIQSMILIPAIRPRASRRRNPVQITKAGAMPVITQACISKYEKCT